MNVVLVHGILDNGGIFKKMIRFFESKGVRCYAPSLEPSDGRNGLEELAIQLKRGIDGEFTQAEKLSIVGFSMGAMITRYYLQRLEGYQRTRQFFSVSAPHYGSLWSHCFPGKGVKQMCRNSGFLRELDECTECLQGLEIYSYWTPFDLVIIPPRSSVWDLAQNIKINALCHPCMLWNRKLIAHIYAHLKNTAT